MKAKIFFAILILISVFGLTSLAVAQTMTDAQRQAEIALLQSQIAALNQQIQQQLALQQGTSAWCFNFNTNLGWAQSGTNDVVNLHLALQQQGLSYSPDTGSVYNQGTSNAVIAFQQKYGINAATPGYVGATTRAELNQLYGCNATATNNNVVTNSNLPAGCTSTSGYSTTTGQPCSGAVTNTTASNCTLNSQTVCSNGAVYYEDSCGNLGSLVQNCSNGCSNGACAAAANNCTSNYQQICSNGSLYYQDSCGNLGNLIQTCPNGCSNGACAGSNTIVANNCIATCVTQSGLTYPIDCSGNVGSACASSQICQKTYNTTNTYNSTTGTIQTTQTLTGSQCATPTPVLTSISITPSTYSLTTGNATTLTANAHDQNGNYISTSSINWTSSNSSIASVSSYGAVTAGSTAGTATITASAVNSSNITITGTATITVTNSSSGSGSITSITLTPSSETLTIGSTWQLTATDQNGNQIPLGNLTWYSSSSAATVNSTGLVTGVSTGTTTITATSGSTTSNSATITVAASSTSAITAINISPSSFTLAVGLTQQLTATDQNGNQIPVGNLTWYSGSSAATVSTMGLVTGVSASSTPFNIYATNGSVQGSASLTSVTVSNTGSAPAIASIFVINLGNQGYIDVGDTITITFSAPVNPASINSSLTKGGSVSNVPWSSIGGMSVSSLGRVTIGGITMFTMGTVSSSGTFTDKLSLDSTGTVLTIVLTNGNSVKITSEAFAPSVTIGGTVKDAFGNTMVSANGVTPSGSFGGVVTSACSVSSDCGTNAYTGSPSCYDANNNLTNNIYQSYIAYTCNNPGTANAYCSNSTSTQLETTCASSQSCSAGACVTNTTPLKVIGVTTTESGFQTTTPYGTSGTNGFNGGSIQITFSRAINPASINSSLTAGGNTISIPASSTGGFSLSTAHWSGPFTVTYTPASFTILNILTYQGGYWYYPAPTATPVFTSQISLDSTGTILTINPIQTQGNSIPIQWPAGGMTGSVYGGTVKDLAGNSLSAGVFSDAGF